MVYVLDVLDLIEAQIQARKVYQAIQASDMRDEVVVEIELP